MKSIRKCDEKVTAQQLGVKVGDKFVVLSPEESYNKVVYSGNFRTGAVVELMRDDGTSCPVFKLAGTGGELSHEREFVYFSCLARYEAPAVQEELSLQNVKFDMKAIAEELGVSLEKAHNIVQTALFEHGVSWYDGKHIKYTNSDWLFVDNLMLTYDDVDAAPEYKLMSIKPKYSFYVKEEKPETIEFNGKQYNKEDVAKALALLSPIE